MARNSFMLKGWAITVFAGVLALADTDHIFVPLIATIVTTVMFWYLDSFYLQQERLYLSLYDKARATSNNDIDFSLKATQDEFPSRRNTICSCLFSKTEKRFYGILLVAQSAMNGASKTPRKCVRTVYRCVLRCLSHIYAIEF